MFQSFRETAPSDPTGPRFCVEDIYPCVDGGRYPVKRIAGEPVEVWADISAKAMTCSPPSCCGARKPRPTGSASRWRSHSNDRWHGTLHPAGARPLSVCDRSLDRPVRHLAQGISCSSATPARMSRSRRRKAASCSANSMPRDAERQARSISARDASSTAPRRRRPAGRRARARRSRRATRADLTRSVADPADRRPAARARRRLVRDGAAQPGHVAGPARHLRRLHRAAAGDRRARLRRALPHADPSDRHDQPQGHATTR